MQEAERSHADLSARMIEYWDLMYRVQRIMTRAATLPSVQSLGEEASIVDPATMGRNYFNLGLSLLQHPADLMAMQTTALKGVADVWMAGFGFGKQGVKDRRFRGDSWENDPVARILRDMHLAMENASKTILKGFSNQSRERLSLEFYTRQILSALAPSNVLALNPEARARFLATRGKSLLDGFENLLDDIERGGGRLAISTTAPDAFIVGRDLAATPGKVVYRNDLIELIQYEAATEQQFRKPLLFVPSWINKFYILDMRPDNSLIRYAIERGHSVFTISWVNPSREHAKKSFESYMNEGIIAALDAIEAATGEKQCNVIGYCIGGILLNATLAYLAATCSNRIASATTLVTMSDFTEVGEIGIFVDQVKLDAMRRHLEKVGHLEDHQLREMYAMLRENDLIWPFYIANYLMGDKPPAFDLLFWNSDSTRLPASMFIWYLENIYVRNGLREPGAIVLNGAPIDLSRIDAPCFILGTKEDHIAPWAAVYSTTQLLGGNFQFVLGGSGHIAGVINPPGEKQKYGYWTNTQYPPDPDKWLNDATYFAGSWWPYWATWLEDLNNNERVEARMPGGGALPVLGPAPGQYVLVR